jgi:hypothetical protein
MFVAVDGAEGGESNMDICYIQCVWCVMCDIRESETVECDSAGRSEGGGVGGKAGCVAGKDRGRVGQGAVVNERLSEGGKEGVAEIARGMSGKAKKRAMRRREKMGS